MSSRSPHILAAPNAVSAATATALAHPRHSRRHLRRHRELHHKDTKVIVAEVMNWVLCTYGKVNFDNAGIAAIADLLSEQFPKIPKRRGKSFSWYNKLYNAASNRRNHSVSSSVPSSPPPSVRESPHRNHSPAAPMGVQEAYKDAIHAVNTVDLTPSAKVSHGCLLLPRERTAAHAATAATTAQWCERCYAHLTSELHISPACPQRQPCHPAVNPPPTGTREKRLPRHDHR